MTPAEIVDDREGLRAARPRRRRLPDRAQVVVHEPKDDGKPHYLVLQRRRVGARHVQGPRDHAVDAARADRGLRHRRVRDRRRDAATSTSAASSPSRWSVMEARGRRGVRRRRRSATNAMGTGKRIDVVLHRGAGAYICGEETALMNSLEGKRGNPRIKPPFPAVAGVFGMPTTINNVETLAAVPHIINRGARVVQGALRSDNPKSTGTKLFSVCGHVQRPGNYEVDDGHSRSRTSSTTCAAARCPGRKFKAVIPGGSSVPIMNAGGGRGGAHGLRGHRGRRARCSARPA